MTATEARKRIRAIDKQVDAIHAELAGLEKINPMSAASWQRAWDKHPELRQRETALFRERGNLQLVRDTAESKIKAREVVAAKIRETKSAHANTGVFQYLFDCKDSAKRLGVRDLYAWYAYGLDFFREME